MNFLKNIRSENMKYFAVLTNRTSYKDKIGNHSPQSVIYQHDTQTFGSYEKAVERASHLNKVTKNLKYGDHSAVWLAYYSK